MPDGCNLHDALAYTCRQYQWPHNDPARAGDQATFRHFRKSSEFLFQLRKPSKDLARSGWVLRRKLGDVNEKPALGTWRKPNCGAWHQPARLERFASAASMIDEALLSTVDDDDAIAS